MYEAGDIVAVYVPIDQHDGSHSLCTPVQLTLLLEGADSRGGSTGSELCHVLQFIGMNQDVEEAEDPLAPEHLASPRRLQRLEDLRSIGRRSQ